MTDRPIASGDFLTLHYRLSGPDGAALVDTFSQQPASRCHHLLQVPTVESRDEAAGVYTTRCAFHYVETRRDEQQLLAGWALHTLVATPAGLRIREKRVDLVNCDAAFGNLQLFM